MDDPLKEFREVVFCDQSKEDRHPRTKELREAGVHFLSGSSGGGNEITKHLKALQKEQQISIEEPDKDVTIENTAENRKHNYLEPGVEKREQEQKFHSPDQFQQRVVELEARREERKTEEEEK